MSKKCLQIKNKGPSWKVSMIGLQKLLRLDSSPPRFLNCQKTLAWLGLTFTDNGNVISDEDEEHKNADGDGTSDIGEQTTNDGK